jgi:CPA2 family monovalent cation:H+ antiporter-2
VPHDLPVLRELVILAGCSLAIILLFNRLRLPAVVGFIATGVLIGPGGLSLVREEQTIQTVAEIGVVLLLFTVGLEFSVADLLRLGRRAVVAGALQVAGTGALVALAVRATGAHPGQAVFFGLLVALSSTALMLKLLTDRGELQAPHARMATGVALFQDLAVVPLALAAPLLGAWVAGRGGPQLDLGSALRTVAVAAQVALVFLLARRLVPGLLAHASRARLREAFLAGVIVVSLGSAYLTYSVGLSLALGAFLAGIVLAESELRTQVVADVIPFRDSFSSVFFISMGMLFVPSQALRHPGIVVASTVGMVALKAVAATLAGRLAGYSWRVAGAGGLVLAQVGEFSFVLAQAGAVEGLMPEPWAQGFYAGAVFSLLLTPWVVSRAPEWALRLEMVVRRVHAEPLLPVGEGGEAAASPLQRDHVVIAGFGLNGRNVARVLRAVRIPHVVVDMAPEVLAQCAAEGSRGLLGDATRPEVLRQAGAARARVLVLALSDPIATKHASRLARELNSRLFIVVRTRYVTEIDDLYAAGANLVIPEEFETSIEIFTAVLREFHVPGNIVQAQIELLRQEHYSLLRGRRLPGSVLEQLDTLLTRGTTETVLLLQRSPAVGCTLAEAGLRDTPGSHLVAVVRGGDALTAFGDDFRLRVGDTLVVTGTHAGIDTMLERLAPPPGAG